MGKILINRYLEFKFRNKRRYYEEMLSGVFDKPTKLVYQFRKSSRDSIYKLNSDGKTYGVARIRNPYRLQRQARLSNRSYQEVVAKSKIFFDRELAKMYKAGPCGLSPQLLYAREGVTVSEYIDAPLASEIIKKDKNKIEPILTLVINSLAKLHNEADIIHGEASLYHCFVTADNKGVFFDFESDAAQVDSASRFAYDYLHLIDRGFKFLPKQYQNLNFWFDMLKDKISPKAKGAKIGSFVSAFPRINEVDKGLQGVEKFFRRGQHRHCV